MRESKAKKSILRVAEEMFSRVGYANLNVNEIAHEAGVSIGTLYYHFPKGKVSILMEIRGKIAEKTRGGSRNDYPQSVYGGQRPSTRDSNCS